MMTTQTLSKESALAVDLAHRLQQQAGAAYFFSQGGGSVGELRHRVRTSGHGLSRQGSCLKQAAE